MSAYVEFKDVKKIYKTGEVEIHALRDVNFEIEKGEFCVIVGASGAGKTTILNILGGMDTLSGGSVYLDGKEISGLNKRQLTAYRRYDVGFVFQFYNLVQNLTALENVELAAQICKDPLDAATVLKQVGLEDRMANYLNIASIYVDNLGSDTADMPQRTIALLTEANEKLDENSTALSNALPEDRNVKYYTAQYARILYSVYSYQAKNTNVDAEKETYYLSAIDSLNRYLASIDITDPNLPDTTKKSYVKYMKEEAETYIALEKISDNKDYYDQAEKVYSSAESSMGTVDNAADIYVSHLTYLYDRYSGEYGSNPKRWKQDGIQKIKAVYDAGSKINILASRGNNEWNSLIVNSAISDIINGNTAVTGSEE